MFAGKLRCICVCVYVWSGVCTQCLFYFGPYINGAIRIKQFKSDKESRGD